MIGLTDMQQQVLEYIDECIEHTGTAPSLQEIAAHVGLRARSGAQRLVKALEERGHIRRLKGKARAIEVVKANAGNMKPGRFYVEPLPEVRLAMERYAVENHVSLKVAAEAALRDWFVGGAS